MFLGCGCNKNDILDKNHEGTSSTSLSQNDIGLKYLYKLLTSAIVLRPITSFSFWLNVQLGFISLLLQSLWMVRPDKPQVCGYIYL